MTIRTLRKKLTDKQINWVDSSVTTADDDGRFIPKEKNGTNYTLMYIPKYGMLQIDNGVQDVIKIPMSEKQYRTLFDKHGYKTAV